MIHIEKKPKRNITIIVEMVNGTASAACWACRQTEGTSHRYGSAEGRAQAASSRDSLHTSNAKS